MSTYRRQRLLGRLDVLDEMIAEASSIAGASGFLVRAWAEERRRWVQAQADEELERARQVQIDKITGTRDDTDWAATVSDLVERHGLTAVVYWARASAESVKRWADGKQTPRHDYRVRLRQMDEVMEDTP